jgi:hypothetical protein
VTPQVRGCTVGAWTTHLAVPSENDIEIGAHVDLQVGACTRTVDRGR